MRLFQERTQEAIANLRKELSAKDQLISSSEEQLAQVQDQLKSTIENVASETTRLKQRIEELEQLLSEKDELLRQITETKEQEDGEKEDLISRMREELEAARNENEKLQDIAEQMASFTGDEHYKEMLQESKCAVEKVKEQLSYTYDQWDCMKGRMRDSADEIGDSPSDLLNKYAEEKQRSLSLITDIGQCNEKVKELEAKLREAQKTISKLREQTGDLEQTSAENKALRRHSTEVQEVAKEQIEELVEHLRKAKEKIAELETENDRLRRGLADTSRMLETIEGDTDSDSLQKLRRELDEVQQEKARLEALIKSLQEGATGDDPQQQLIRLKADYAALEEQLQKEIALRQAAEAKLSDVEARLLSGAGGGDTEELERLRKELANAQQENERLQERIMSERTQSEQRAAKLNRELDDLADTVKEKTRRNTVEVGELEAELIRLRAENQQLKEQQAATKDEGPKPPPVTTAAVGVDTAELTALREERDKLLKQIEDQNKEISGLLEQMKAGADAAAVAEIEKQQREKQALQELVDKLQKQLRDLSATPQVTDTSDLGVADTIRRMSQQLEGEERNARELQEKHNKCQQELEKLRQQLQQATGTLSVTQTGADDQIRRLSQQVEGGELQAQELKNQLTACQQELTRLRGQLGNEQELRRASQEFETNNARCQEEIDRLKQQLRQKEDELEIEKKNALSTAGELKELQDAMVGDDPDGVFKALQNTLNTTKTENESLQKENATLKQRISALEDENKKLKDQLGGAVTEVERTRRTSKGKKKTKPP